MSADLDSVDNSNLLAEDITEFGSWSDKVTSYPGGYWDEIDPKFYGEGTPNDPPIYSVPEVLAADIQIIEDKEIVREVSNFWFPEEPDRYTQVIRVTFNDLRTWNWPLAPWDQDKEVFRFHFVETYIPEILKWRSIVNDEDYEELMERYKRNYKPQYPDWEELLEYTEISEEDRKWFNQNCDWLPHLDKRISNDVDLDIDDEERFSWMDEEW